MIVLLLGFRCPVTIDETETDTDIPDTDACEPTIASWSDADGDGHGDPQGAQEWSCELPSGRSLVADDCDDQDAAVHPGAAEPCGSAADVDCDGLTSDRDDDRDGWAACEDCDDGRRWTHPDAWEWCDEADNDCDGVVDEDPVDARWFYRDTDGDGLGDARDAEHACARPDGYTDVAGDCDDHDPIVLGPDLWYRDHDRDGWGSGWTWTWSCDDVPGYVENGLDCDDSNSDVHPGADEDAGAGDDSDCDGWYSCYEDGDADGWGAAVVATWDRTCLSAGLSPVGGDCDDGAAATSPGAIEAPASGVDADCDGWYACYADVDGDGYGAGSALAADASCGSEGLSAVAGDCDDADAAISPDGTDVPASGVDADCDGSYACYADGDGDGHGAAAVATSDASCASSGISALADDCDDGDAAIVPGAADAAADGVDQDCDGYEPCYADLDGDLHGAGLVLGALGCAAAGLAILADDCDDLLSAVSPSATEVTADEIDGDCDGVEVCWEDLDGDGHTSSSTVLSADTDCDDAGEGASASVDCDDTNAEIFPGATDVPGDTADDDCDGALSCFADLDLDGYGGDPTLLVTATSCAEPGASDVFTDCDDTTTASAPWAVELCDAADNDCDGYADDADPDDVPADAAPWYWDLDGDKYGGIRGGYACVPPAGTATGDTDCDDGDSGVFAGALETPANGVDNDCDGTELCYVDSDGDGHGTAATATSPVLDCLSSGESPYHDDCDDTRPDLVSTCGADTADTGAPGATEASIKNVFVILMENNNWSNILGNTTEAPYINNVLLPISSYADNYYATPTGVHPSLPNYIYLEAGSTMGITSNADPSATQKVTSTDHLTTQLEDAGIEWHAWAEGAPSGCPTTSSGYYAAKHVPFVYFTDIAGDPPSASAATCLDHVHPYSEFSAALTAGVTGYHFVTPNLCNDMHDTCGGTSAIRNGDDFLAILVPEIMATAAYDEGVIFITFDESIGGEHPIMMLVLSPFAKGGGYSNTTLYNHASLLRTVETIYGLPLLRDAATYEDLSDLFATFP